MSSSELRVGILGSGWAAAHHALGYQGAGITIAAVCARDPERRQRFAERFRIADQYADPCDLFRRQDIDAVSVCTPNVEHAPLTLAALAAGKHVLCEKPPAATAEEAAAMAERADELRLVLTYALQRRHNPATEALRIELAERRLGDVYHAKATWARTWGVPGGVDGWFVDPARSAGGALLDIGVHVLDLTWYLLGRPRPRSVSGQVHRRHAAAGGNDESAFAFLRFEDGPSVELEASWLLPQESDRMGVQLFGTGGGARLDDHHLDLFTIGADGTERTTPPLDGHADAFVAQARHFADAIRGAPPRTPASDGVALMRMIDGIYRSSREGREVLL